MVRELTVSNSACNYLQKELQECYTEHPFRKYIGHCSPICLELERCIQKQHNLRQEVSWKRSKEYREKLQGSKPKKDA